MKKTPVLKNKPAPGAPPSYDIFPIPRQVRSLSPLRLDARHGKPRILLASCAKNQPLIRLAIQQVAAFCKSGRVTRRPSGQLTIMLAVNPQTVPADQTGQGYRLCIHPDRSISITGATPLGLLYGVQTLAQLLEQSAGRLPCVEITDWPDFEYRLSSNWLQNCEVARWGFDRGQGCTRFIADGKKRIDWALKYKINMIYFDFSHGDSRVEMFQGYTRILSTLNRYARNRGIRLMTGIITVCGMLNRKSYPHGTPYQCPTRMIQGQNVGDPPFGGWCWSNRQAWGIKCAKIRRYVQANEPGALYIHGIDIARFKDVAASWKTRCPRCRRLWPEDDIASPHGMAGAYAHIDNLMLDAIFSVKNQRTGYDARRDCLVCLIAPGYGFYFEDDDDWQGEIRYYEQLSRGLKYVDNVQIGIREQGFNKSNRRRRVSELAARLRRNAQGHGVFVDVFSGYPGGGCTTEFPGSGFVYYRPIQPLPLIYPTFAGAATVASMEAHADFEAHTILCNNFAWNSRSGGTALLRNYREWQNIYEGAYRGFYYPDRIFGNDGILQTICRHLYGVRAGQLIAQAYSLRSIDEDEALPLFQPESLVPMRAAWKPALAPPIHLAWQRRWERIEQLTREAGRLMQAGRSQPDFNPTAAATIDWQIKVLGLGVKMTAFLKTALGLCAGKQGTDHRHIFQNCRWMLCDLQRFITTNFPSDTRQFFQPAERETSIDQYTPNDPTLYPVHGLLSNMCLWKHLLQTFTADLGEIKRLKR